MRSVVFSIKVVEDFFQKMKVINKPNLLADEARFSTKSESESSESESSELDDDAKALLSFFSTALILERGDVPGLDDNDDDDEDDSPPS